jgi:hypothetical protein
VTNGNIYAPTMMLAEKAADLIRGNTPLPPINVPFYRHQPGGGAGGDGARVDATANGADQSAPATTAGGTEQEAATG